ncbi:MAG: hypothetical protein H6810_06925 [Phycisphaeraceae bacterium]|nr:MAG: hypothetical protein H6810_06925 [Phycisphaeraceae bacterium]
MPNRVLASNPPIREPHPIWVYVLVIGALVRVALLHAPLLGRPMASEPVPAGAGMVESSDDDRAIAEPAGEAPVSLADHDGFGVPAGMRLWADVG